MSLNKSLLKKLLLSVLTLNERSWDLGVKLLSLVWDKFVNAHFYLISHLNTADTREK